MGEDQTKMDVHRKCFAAAARKRHSLERYVHHVQCHHYLKILLLISVKSFQFLIPFLPSTRVAHVPEVSQGDEVLVSDSHCISSQCASQTLITMAPTSAAKAEREKKVKDILSITSQLIRLAETSAYERAGFASKVPNSTKGSTIDPSLANDLRTRIHGLPITTGSARMQELDAAGTELWNLATRLNREPNASEYKRSLCLLRVFAFFLLDSGHSDRVGSLSNRSRLLKVAFKSAKACLAQQELEFSVKILERAAHYVDMNDQHDKDIGAEDALICERLTAEYFVLRTTMASSLTQAGPSRSC